MGHPKAFEAASRLVNIAPRASTTCSSPTPDRSRSRRALKIAIAYHRAKGNASKVRLIGRERGYHGVNLGGTAVGGISNNRKFFGALVTGVDHLRHTHDLSKNAFSRGEPEHGAELADDLERLVALHDASTIAAVIVEPVACSTGVLIPPKGYLKRLAAIAAKHDILLIFDEVITGFGRLGTPFGADYFDVSPDMITGAKGVTNGSIPMGVVFLKSHIYEAFMTGPENAIDLFHGYTYSGHPMAAAAALGTLETYQEEGLLTRAASLASYWEERMHALEGTAVHHRHPQHRPHRRGRVRVQGGRRRRAGATTASCSASSAGCSCARPATSSRCRRRSSSRKIKSTNCSTPLRTC